MSSKIDFTLPSVPVYKASASALASTTPLTPDSAPDSPLYAPGTPGKSYGSRGEESPVYSPGSRGEESPVYSPGSATGSPLENFYSPGSPGSPYPPGQSPLYSPGSVTGSPLENFYSPGSPGSPYSPGPPPPPLRLEAEPEDKGAKRIKYN